MTKEEAYEFFKKYLAEPCPKEDCNAPADELCDDGNAVWIHLERMTGSMAWKEKDGDHKQDPASSAG